VIKLVKRLFLLLWHDSSYACNGDTACCREERSFANANKSRPVSRILDGEPHVSDPSPARKPPWQLCRSAGLVVRGDKNSGAGILSSSSWPVKPSQV